MINFVDLINVYAPFTFQAVYGSNATFVHNYAVYYYFRLVAAVQLAVSVALVECHILRSKMKKEIEQKH